MRTQVADYIEKAIEDSKREGAEDHQGGKPGESSSANQVGFHNDLTSYIP